MGVGGCTSVIEKNITARDDRRIGRAAVGVTGTITLKTQLGIGADIDPRLIRRAAVLENYPTAGDDYMRPTGRAVALEECVALDAAVGEGEGGAASDGEAQAVKGEVIALCVECVVPGARHHDDAAEGVWCTECDGLVDGGVGKRRGPGGDLPADPIAVKVVVAAGDPGPCRVERLGRHRRGQ